MFGHAAKSGQFFYYRCGNALRRGPQACPGRWLPKDKIEGFIIDRIRDYILTDENLRELVMMVNEEIDRFSDGTLIRIQTLDKQIQSLDRRLDRLYEVLETGALDLSDLAPRIKQLVAKKSRTSAGPYRGRKYDVAKENEHSRSGNYSGLCCRSEEAIGLCSDNGSKSAPEVFC